ncbi:MAG TPA: sugar phosphate nucleotidyltransferase [Candidatus Saccharimonadales bacterium]|nr:sugar phosphate nucleotidyltransferase [Candidatus Saccharimonadales bacterium]
MDKQINTAIIMTAGWGTRWLPLTKAVEKYMVPLGSRPVIDWKVQECVDAGITHIIFVVNEQHAQLKRYFSPRPVLENYLEQKGKNKWLDEIRQPQYKGIKFDYIVQPSVGIYGTAVPLNIGYDLVSEGETIAVFNADDTTFRTDGTNEVTDFFKSWRESEASNAIMVTKLDIEDAPKYGVVAHTDDGDFIEIVEQPTVEVAKTIQNPTKNINDFIFGPEVRRICKEYIETKEDDGKEYRITDVLTQVAKEGHGVHVYTMKGEWLDCGNPGDWLRSNQVVVGAKER